MRGKFRLMYDFPQDVVTADSGWGVLGATLECMGSDRLALCFITHCWGHPPEHVSEGKAS